MPLGVRPREGESAEGLGFVRGVGFGCGGGFGQTGSGGELWLDVFGVVPGLGFSKISGSQSNAGAAG